MANSLRTKLKKLCHDGKINQQELDDLLKKLDGHDRELQNQIPKWHLCKDELPSDREKVIARYKEGQIEIVMFSLFLHENPQYTHENPIIAWTELPRFEGVE